MPTETPIPDDAGARIVTVAPEVPGVIDEIPGLVKKGLVVSVGHTNADYGTTSAAFDAGATLVTHVCNAMRTLHHRDPGPIAAAHDRPEVTVTLIADRIHVTDPMLRILWRLFGPDRIVLVTDTIATTAGTLADDDVYVSNGSARRHDGTLAGSVLTMNVALKNMVTVTDASLTEIARMTSTNAARVLRDSTRGTLTPGARADLVACDPASGTVIDTWTAGVRHSASASTHQGAP